MSILKLSIIVPVYNVEKYLEKCLNSLCNLEIENEIIIVNDGTKDNSLEIAKNFKKENEKENIIIISQENKGLSEARNTGLRLAQGEYISFIDRDDFVDKKAYEMLIKEVISDKVEIGIGRYKKIIEKEENLECITEIREYEKGEIKTGKEYLDVMYNKYMYGPEVWDDIFKREFLIKNSIFFKKGRMHEDEIFTLESMLKAEKVKFYGIYYYNYLQRKKSIMSEKTLKNYEDMEKNINEIYDFLLVERDEKIKRILESEIHRLYKIIINHTKDKYKYESIKFKENYDNIIFSYKENKIKKIFLRIIKSLKKKMKKLKKEKSYK